MSTFIEHLWEKHCLISDGENADRMFYEGFCDAATELGEELMRRAEGEKMYGAPSPRIHNQALDTMKQHISKLTGVEK